MCVFVFRLTKTRVFTKLHLLSFLLGQTLIISNKTNIFFIELLFRNRVISFSFCVSIMIPNNLVKSLGKIFVKNSKSTQFFCIYGKNNIA